MKTPKTPLKRRMTKNQREVMLVILEGVRDEEGALIRYVSRQEIAEKLGKDITIQAVLLRIEDLIRDGYVKRAPRQLFDTLDGRRWRTMYEPTDLAIDNFEKIKNVESRLMRPIVRELPEDESGIIVMEGFDDPVLPI